MLCFQGNIYCTLLCKLLGVKIIVRSNSAPDGWGQNLFKHFCFKYIFSFADKIIVNSFEFKKKFKKRFNLKTICIYNPLDKKEIIRKSKIKSKISFNNNYLNIINVGRLTDQKDQITLLKAINEIKNILNFRLIIVGRGKEKSYCILVNRGSNEKSLSRLEIMAYRSDWGKNVKFKKKHKTYVATIFIELKSNKKNNRKFELYQQLPECLVK